LVPIIAYFCIFSVYPIFSALFISLHRWSLVRADRPFVGLRNYVWALNDPVFSISLKNTVDFAVIYVTSSVVLGLILAMIVFSFREPAKSIMQTVLFVPVMMSMVVAGYVWQLMFMAGSSGILNHLLGRIGLPPLAWLNSSSLVMPSIIIMSVWKNVGYFVVLFIAGLTTIPEELYEAAWIDGASSLQARRHISLPLLAPTTLFCLVTGSIGAFQVFTQAYTMPVSRGGPGKASMVLLLYLYDHGFVYFEMGRASAVAFLLFIIILAVTALQMRVMRNRFQY
jgi:multiple sugar transport system permease protein